MKRTVALAAAALLLLPIEEASAQDTGPDAAASGPNVVVVMTDDQRSDDLAPIPKTRRLIGSAGVTFTRFYSSYPVCCPARATFFTGQYAQNHGVGCLYPACGGGYGALNQREYLPVWLERAGYATAHIGKFLNGYGKERGRRWSRTAGRSGTASWTTRPTACGATRSTRRVLATRAGARDSTAGS